MPMNYTIQVNGKFNRMNLVYEWKLKTVTYRIVSFKDKTPSNADCRSNNKQHITTSYHPRFSSPQPKFNR